MSLRSKMFLLLLCFATLPLLLAWWSNSRAFRYTQRDLTFQTNATLVERARQAVEQQVLDHARHLGLKKELLAMAVEMQAAGMTTEEPPRGMGHVLMRHKKHAWYKAMPKQHGFDDANASKPPKPPSFKERMTPVFEAVAARFPDKLLWQAARRDGMPFALHPHPENFAEGKRLATFLKTLPAGPEPTWTGPFTDPITGKQALAVSMGNKTAGLAICAVSIQSVLAGSKHLRNLSPRLGTLLAKHNGNGTGLEILASHWEDPTGAGRDTMAWLFEEPTLVNADRLVEDLQKNQSGSVIIQRPTAVDLLWAYAPINGGPSFLLVSLPIADVTAASITMGLFIEARLNLQRNFGAATLAVVLLLAFFCSLIVSRRMQERIIRLLQGFQEVASGNFSTRVEPGAKDEIGNLANSFNDMVPALEERFHIMQSLDLAHAMQRRLLPHTPPAVPGLEVVGACRYCEATGGDFFDFMSTSKTTMDVVVGDVSGHGLPAALLMATARASLRQRATHLDESGLCKSLGCSMNDVNRQLCYDLHHSGDFVTLTWMHCDPGSGRLTWIRAGHDPALLYDPETDTTQELMGPGIPLGVQENWEFQENACQWRQGQLLVIGTDGIWETQNAAGDWYGKERFKALFQRLAREEPDLQAIRDGLLLDVETFRQGAPQEDDVTIVLVRWQYPGDAAS